jgi:hypothetical protein
VSYQQAKIKALIESFKQSVLQIVSRRDHERANLDTQNLPQHDQGTRQEVKNEDSKLEYKLNKITGVRNDALDTIGGDGVNVSDFNSKLVQAIQKVETTDASAKQEVRGFIHTILDMIPGLESPSESSSSPGSSSGSGSGSGSGSDSDIESNLKKKFEKVNTSSNVVAGPSSNVTAEASNKRKADEAELDSPLDFVLKKQELEPFDPTDDID